MIFIFSTEQIVEITIAPFPKRCMEGRASLKCSQEYNEQYWNRLGNYKLDRSGWLELYIKPVKTDEKLAKVFENG